MLDVGDKAYPVQAFDTTWIPPNVSHRFRNLSATKPMKILWIYASTQATRTVTETGQTRPVSAEHAR
jgi:mannose-6-phosphate isomerase-like protein (cupin superfamily)